MADIFISYSREDGEVAELLRCALEICGWSVWYDQLIDPGATFSTVIEREIERAGCVIVLWSQNSVKSEWVLEEAKFAQDLKRLIPVEIEKVKLPLGFSLVNTVTLKKWNGEIFKAPFIALVKAVFKKVKPSHTTPTFQKLLLMTIKNRTDFSDREADFYERYVNERIKPDLNDNGWSTDKKDTKNQDDDFVVDRIFRDASSHNSKKTKNWFFSSKQFGKNLALSLVLLLGVILLGAALTSTSGSSVDKNRLIDSPQKLKLGETGIFKLNSQNTDLANARYIWDFGNGQSVFGNPVEYVFQKPGKHEISLTVINGQDTTNEKTDINVYHDRIVPQIRSIKPKTENLLTNAPVRFEADVIADDSLSYVWSLGQFELSREESPVLYFKQPGTHDITLLITNDFGVDQQNVRVEITDNPLQNATASR